MTRFIQIHSLSSYPGVLLNRDDAGLAKRLPYGGASRIRVSSQCLKRHWRFAEDQWALKAIGAPMGLRSREIIEREVMPKVMGSEETRKGIAAALVRHIYGPKSASVKDRQIMLLGLPEIRYLTNIAIEAASQATDVKSAEAAIDARIGKGEGKRNLSTMKEVAGKLASGLESALFGRMVTSDPEANADAAIHVAHSFTVHREESEGDYFTVVDDLRVRDGAAGSGGIFDTELTSGLFYGYVVIDVRLLIENLAGDYDLAAKVVEHLIHLIATISPGAKKGSTAPYSYADMLLIELGKHQPRSLAGAFRKPVLLKQDGDVATEAYAVLSTHLSRLDAAYGVAEERLFLSTLGEVLPGAGAPQSLDTLARRAAEAVRTTSMQVA